ncbi:hypothetical protein [Microtetraspora malaysiensis]
MSDLDPVELTLIGTILLVIVALTVALAVLTIRVAIWGRRER